MLALGYVRLSRWDESTTSPARQREVIEDLCRARGWTLVEVFEDLDVSGAKEQRAGLDEMLRRLDDVGAVVVWKLDRLARSLPHLLKLADAFEAAGVQLVTSDGEVDTTTAGGRAFYQMRGVFAEFERRTVAERSRAMHAYLRAEGRVQTRVPFGFRVNDERRAERDPETWPTMVAIAEGFAAGQSLRQLGVAFGVPHTTVRVYVRNAKTIAELERDRPDLAAALRERLQDDGFRPGARALLAGLARCSACGEKLRQEVRDGRRVYGCKAGGHVRIGAEWLDDFVVSTVLYMMPQLGARRAAAAPKDTAADVEKMLEELEDDRDAGLVSRARFAARRAKLLDRLAAARSASPAPRLASVEWKDLTHDERRLALREVLDYVEVRPVPAGQPRGVYRSDRVVIGIR